MLKKDARAITGNLSETSKMPCLSYNLPAQECKAGAKLVHVKNSVCSKCYVLCAPSRYTQFAYAVLPAQYKHFRAIRHPKWVDAMTTLIKGMPYFRWHDSGDLQGQRHLRKICKVTKATPDTKHWLPTREYRMVHTYKDPIPSNLIIRLSGQIIDGPAPKGQVVSSVFKDKSPAQGAYVCPAYSQGGKCLDCRACWDTGVQHVTYKLH